jgi:hypothetical protein
MGNQLNCYAYLYRRHGFEVNALRVIAIFRDWQRCKSGLDKDYPKQVEVFTIDLWEDARVEDFINTRIAELKEALTLPDDFIPECTPFERWQADTQYAVCKPGNVRALRVFDSMQDAEAYKNGHKEASSLYIVTRQEAPKRCKDYCPVKRFCHYYQSINPNKLQEAV